MLRVAPPSGQRVKSVCGAHVRRLRPENALGVRQRTLGYLARVAPRFGMAAGLSPAPAYRYGWRRDGGAYGSEFATAADPADRAFDGGGLVIPWAPTGDRTGRGTGSGT